jgi:hypothetical protein
MFDSPSTVRGNTSTHIPENLHIPLDGGLWRAMTTHFLEEVCDSSNPRASDAALTILGMTVDRIVQIDDYVPEPRRVGH